MFLIYDCVLIGSVGLCFNPYYNWTMFFITDKYSKEDKDNLVSILVLTGQCFL